MDILVSLTDNMIDFLTGQSDAFLDGVEGLSEEDATILCGLILRWLHKMADPKRRQPLNLARHPYDQSLVRTALAQKPGLAELIHEDVPGVFGFSETLSSDRETAVLEAAQRYVPRLNRR